MAVKTSYKGPLKKDEIGPGVTGPSASTVTPQMPEAAYTGPEYPTANQAQTVPQSQYYAQKATNPTELTSHYRDRMLETDDMRPDPYASAYEGRIADILDTIYNRKAFNINDDANYNQLYNNYAEQYRSNADRSMRDTMASAQAATGGYGSTYAQVAGQQAYDQTMEGLNDRNMQLMQMAYNMYADDRANDYNKLGAFQGQDQIEYGRYRDGYNDWLTDRNYYANRYDNSFQDDYTAYQNALGTAQNLAASGLPVPEYLTDVIDRYNAANGLGGSAATSLAAIAAQAVKPASGRGGGSDTGKTPQIQIYSSGSGAGSGKNDSDYARGQLISTSYNNIKDLTNLLRTMGQYEQIDTITDAEMKGIISESQANALFNDPEFNISNEDLDRHLEIKKMRSGVKK